MRKRTHIQIPWASENRTVHCVQINSSAITPLCPSPYLLASLVPTKRRISPKRNPARKSITRANSLSRGKIAVFAVAPVLLSPQHLKDNSSTSCSIPHAGASARTFGSNLPTDVVTFGDTLQPLSVASCGRWVLLLLLLFSLYI